MLAICSWLLLTTKHKQALTFTPLPLPPAIVFSTTCIHVNTVQKKTCDSISFLLHFSSLKWTTASVMLLFTFLCTYNKSTPHPWPWTYERGHKKHPEFIYKKLCIYSYMFKLQSPSKCSPLDAIHLSRLFPLLKPVFELVNFDAF